MVVTGAPPCKPYLIVCRLLCARYAAASKYGGILVISSASPLLSPTPDIPGVDGLDTYVVSVSADFRNCCFLAGMRVQATWYVVARLSNIHLTSRGAATDFARMGNAEPAPRNSRQCPDLLSIGET